MSISTGIKTLAIAALAAVSLGTHATTLSSEGYSIEDFKLRSASDLVDVCTIETSHPDHAIATAFCYGFFEGAARYDEAISGTEWYVDIVCTPADASRSQAVAVFVEHLGANPQYSSDTPIDAVFRALSAQWPCSK
jgi:hypothetical protein